jgi:hypothetical protein
VKRAGKWTEGSSVDTAGGAWTVGSLGREIAGRQLGDELLERAPDLFAFTDVVLVRSEAYRFAVSAPDGASWPPPEMPRLVSRGCRRQRRLVHLGKAPQTTVNATENPILRAQNGVDRTDCSTPERRQCALRWVQALITRREQDPVVLPSAPPQGVHLFKKYLISGCFGHAARLRRSMVSSS